MPLLLRGALLLAGLWLAVRVLPALPDAGAAVLVAALGGLIALPGAWASAVRRGHDLGVLAPGGQMRWLLAGPGLRLAGAGLLGAGAAILLFLRLLDAGPGLWLLAGLTLPLTWALMAALAPRLAHEATGLHARRLAHLWARLCAVGVMLGLSLVFAVALPLSPPVPAEGPTLAAPLVAEALALARLWAGLEAFALGEADAFGAWGRGAAAVVGLSALAGVFWALTTLAVALTLPRVEMGRALGPASDAPAPPPPGRLGPGVAAGLALAVVLAGLGGGWILGAVPPESRPSARIEVVAEMIGDALYVAGTSERIAALRADALAEDAAARARLRAALEAGFEAMERNVDPFLDDYYSLSGEYGRMLRWVTGRLEAFMTDQLATALQEGAPFAELEALQVRLLAEAEARAAELASAEATILQGARIEGANPALLRVTARHGTLPLPPELLAADLQRAQLRWGAAAGTGVVAVAMARRVAAGLASRGLMATAARVLVRGAGLVLAFGLDYALVKLDEYQNRDDFRAAILAEIAAQRATALAALDGPQR